jgi:hypothetical protein
VVQSSAGIVFDDTVIFVDRMLNSWDIHTFVNISDLLVEHARSVRNVAYTTKKMKKKVVSVRALANVSRQRGTCPCNTGVSYSSPSWYPINRAH